MFSKHLINMFLANNCPSVFRRTEAFRNRSKKVGKAQTRKSLVFHSFGCPNIINVLFNLLTRTHFSDIKCTVKVYQVFLARKYLYNNHCIVCMIHKTGNFQVKTVNYTK